MITGVVGDTKPQFSLIGHTVNKTSRLCSACPKMSVQVSKEAFQKISTFSNTFQFKKTSVTMKGIGKESSYLVQKVGNLADRAKSAAKISAYRSQNFQQTMETP